MRNPFAEHDPEPADLLRTKIKSSRSKSALRMLRMKIMQWQAVDVGVHVDLIFEYREQMNKLTNRDEYNEKTLETGSTPQEETNRRWLE